MKLLLKTKSPDVEIEFFFLLGELIEVINKTDFAVGTQYAPIPMNGFVNNNVGGLPVVKAGVTLSLFVNTNLVNVNNDKISDIELIYASIRNVTKGPSSYMSEDNWSEYFEIEDMYPQITVAPNGILYIRPVDLVCSITSKKDIDIIVSYSAVISFMFNGRKFYGMFDPLVKVSSGGR